VPQLHRRGERETQVRSSVHCRCSLELIS
jgi:hypothetical protein